MRTRLRNYFVIAIALLSLIALVGSAQAAADLEVDKNHPGYIFSNITNVMTAYVTNSGNANAAGFNVSIEVTNATGVLNSSKATGVSVNAGATESVSLGNWTPTKVEDIWINVTADCDNDVPNENNETNNFANETRTAIVGSCVDPGGPTGVKVFEKECFGYRGQHPLTQAYTGGSDVIYTVGDYMYQHTEVNFNIGAPGGDVNRVDSYIADIPDSADIKQATLYLYHDWRRFEMYGWWDWTLNFTNSTDTYTVAETVNYTDCKGFGTDYMRERLYGTIVYNVTDYVTGDGTYTANVTGDLYPYPGYSTSYGQVEGMALMVVYDDGTPMVYRIAHGHDRLATYYQYSATSRSSYNVLPANATTNATLMNANSSGDVTYARLFTATVNGVDQTDGSAEGESLKCNDRPWDVGAWTNDGMGSGNDYPIGFGRDDVTSWLSDDVSDETVEMQETDATDNLNGYSVVFALMQACNRTLTNVTSCDDGGDEKHSFAQGEKVYARGCGLAANTDYKIWIQNYPVNEDEAIVVAEDPSTTKGDNVTTDGSGCFPATEVWNISATAPITYKQYDIVVDRQGAGVGQDTFNSGDPDGIDDACVEGFLAPVPEFATIALFGMGLLMLAGYVYLGRRRRRA